MRPDRLALWRIVPGLVANPLLNAPYDSFGDLYGIAISPDGRLLAIACWRGFDVWDLVTHRRVSHAGSQYWEPAFEPLGDLIVASRWGLCRWPRQTLAGEIRFGPPQILSEPLADSMFGLSSDGRVAAILAKSGWQLIHLHDNNRVVRVPWKKDARGASVSPDGAWLSLTNWHEEGVNIWDTTNGQHVASLTAGRTGKPLFSPDGRWLATTPDGVRLWHTGDWQPGPELHAQGTTPGGLGIAFSPDSRVLAVGQSDEITRLVDPETGNCYAEFQRPDSRNSRFLAFTPDQSQLIEVPSGDRGAPRIWDLAEIRRELANRGLDWPADVLQFKPLATDSRHWPGMTVVLDEGNLPNKAAAAELIRKAAGAKDVDARDLLEQAIQLDPESAGAQNNLAWLLVARPDSLRDTPKGVSLARRAVQLDGKKGTYWNTLGVALCRDGQYSEAIEALDHSLQRGDDSAAGFDLIFLALCHFRMGNATIANDYYIRAETWLQQHSRLSPLWQEELNAFFAEAKAIGLPKVVKTD
jgi:WD40 repeat protein